MIEEPSEQQQKELDEQTRGMYAQMAQDEKELHELNCKLLEENAIPNEAVKNLLDGCCLNGILEIVEEPTGDDQDSEDEFFQKIFVEQWSDGWEGDSFAGYIYGKFDENKWLKVPYYC